MRDVRIERWGSLATTLFALFALRPVVTAPPAPAVIAAPPIVVPSVITVRVPAPVPAPVVVTTIVMAPPKDELACPVPPRADDAAIGVPADPGFAGSSDDGGRRAVAASAAAPVIALVSTDGSVRASTDDGRTFTDIFVGAPASSIAVDDRGRIYAISRGRLGVRDLRGRERWLDSAAPCGDGGCEDRIAAAGGAVAWIRGASVRTSADGGRTWRTIDDEPGDELVRADRIGYWEGALIGLSHVSDMCGWEADQIARLDVSTRRYAFTSFDNDTGSPKLEIVGDTGATWTYRARGVHGDAAARDLRLASLAPAFGSRLLWAADGQLYELCGDRGRIVAHGFGAPRVDAVDAAGRPLVAMGLHVYRWSARSGWRELDPPPPVADGGD
jgi:hypothetical protein